LKSLGELNMQLELPGAPVSGEAAAATADAMTPEAGAGSADEPVLDDSASAASHSDADEAGDDELSADGGGSRELVAAPPGDD
jgi:hypothetical protein